MFEYLLQRALAIQRKRIIEYEKRRNERKEGVIGGDGYENAEVKFSSSFLFSFSFLFSLFYYKNEIILSWNKENGWQEKEK